MRAHTLVRTAIVGFVALVAATTSLRAFCNSAIETYAIFQCAQRAYFAPLPSPFTHSNVTGVFWQLGFGNAGVSTGLGTDGTGFASKAFNGNDSGSFPVNFLDAPAVFPTQGFPAGSICLGSNNWANSGVDGCCDNPRPAATFSYTNYYSGLGPYDYANDDNILNPYFGTFQNAQNYPGYFSIASVMDYPTAILARTPGDAFFALAAVTNMNRSNNFDPNDMATWTGPCQPLVPGTNQGTCDIRQGFMTFADVTTGGPNTIPSEAGKNNVIPWQVPPVPVLDNSAPVDPNDPNSFLVVDLSWPAVTFHHDGRSVASNNPTLDTLNPGQPGDPNAAPGVGVPDILGKFGLVRYQLQVAADNDVSFTTITQTIICPGDPGCGPGTTATLTVSPTECVRIRTHFGTPPRETMAFSTATCRLGMCGDIGFGVNGARLCVGPCNPDPNGEMCNGLDDDCDSQVDEGFSIGQVCNGIGQCGQGTLECQDLTSARCSTEPGGSEADPNDIGNPGYKGPLPEICDGFDNDCDASTDEDFVLGGSCTGVGECANDPNGFPITGAVECDGTDPNTTQCSTDPGGTQNQSDTELCDSLDNDCDGATDEIFNLGAICDGVGACGAGLFECDPNAIGAICSTDPGGSSDQALPESCDGLDNDCDASTDEDFFVGQTCDGVGACGTGLFECNPFDPNLNSSICSTEPGGSGDQSGTEVCDALDNDCDGSTDETFILGMACTGTGECGAGVTQCFDPNTTFCSSDPGGADDQSVTEICANALDDDCDGQTDELGAAEVCDGNDNDCDGMIDDGFNIGNACTGVGICGAGTIECDAADPNRMNFCSTQPGGSQDASSTERCDTLDNDCDGATDEGFMVGQACNPTTTFGVCNMPPGLRECSLSNPNTTICSTMPGGSQDASAIEICGNGTDDDCDGVNDAVEFSVSAACDPPGACSPGSRQCDPNGGMFPTSSVCSTGPGGTLDESSPEICDGLDNDCNGFTDEGSGQPCEVFGPVANSSVDCSDPRAVQLRMRWYAKNFDVFRPQIGWDPGFAKKQRIQSFVSLKTDFWEPNGKQWKKACDQAFKENPGSPVLYFRVLRKDLDLPKNDPGREDVTPVVAANPFFARADLSITKDDGQSSYTPGGTLTYTIRVFNAGPFDVTGATVIDAFPAALINVTWTCVASGTSACAASGSGSLNESVDLAADGSVTFTVNADVLGSATGDLSNTAQVVAPPGVLDPDLGDTFDSDTDVETP